MSLEAAHQAFSFPTVHDPRRLPGAGATLPERFPRMAPLGFDFGALPASESYSRTVARCFNLESAPTGASTSLKRAQLSTTRLSSEASGVGRSSPLPVEKAYVVMLQLQDAVGNQIWDCGRAVDDGPALAGSISIAHLEDEPTADLRVPFDMLLIHLPELAFDELAEHHGATAATGLAETAGEPDPIVHHLGRALLPWLEQAQSTSSLFFDHVAFAIHSRLASRYGGLQRLGTPTGGLAAWQERVAKEALSADLTVDPDLDRVAGACRLPVGRFLRAFHQTTGMPPHRWLRGFRVERAKDLLLNSTLALAQIAYDCGFSGQSHFTRVFGEAVGITPGAWRRARRA